MKSQTVINKIKNYTKIMTGNYLALVILWQQEDWNISFLV